MSDDLHFLDTSSNEIRRGLVEFKERCDAILDRVFGKKLDERRDFGPWFDAYVKATDDAPLVLHQEPIYVVCRYMQFDPKQLSNESLRLATYIANQEKWYE